ncbi:hypothetical protein L0657_06930 [Dyadobacter sp. CY345]|uniref:hypothetical protein n=1 Tax=Dyadobacter sp. CY345 TaxID=2909335 RepID=UPI001F304E28|nr:hypothetical protein [Dyadobacter sp. CY345]MCF2443683.1 hypothetical protein [Dyadobacter sp. CY345]
MKKFVVEFLKSLLLTVTILTIVSCKSDDPTGEDAMVCGSARPAEELLWLRNQVNEFYGGEESNAVVLYNFNGEQVIEVQNSVFSSTNQHQYLCDGTKLDLDDANKFKEFKDNREEVKVIYGTKIWN